MNSWHEMSDWEAEQFAKSQLRKWKRDEDEGTEFSVFDRLRWDSRKQAIEHFEKVLSEHKAEKDKEDKAAKVAAENKLFADRYRWLRAEHFKNSPLAAVSWKAGKVRNCSEWVNTGDGNDLDAAIDAAMGRE